MKNKDEMLFANDVPIAPTHGKMVAKLVCETANLKKRINDLLKENTEWKLENKRLNNIINELEKYIVEEIDDAQEELNIILQGNNLDYKNECTKEFNCIKNALDMLLDKLKELKENNK